MYVTQQMQIVYELLATIYVCTMEPLYYSRTSEIRRLASLIRTHLLSQLHRYMYETFSETDPSQTRTLCVVLRGWPHAAGSTACTCIDTGSLTACVCVCVCIFTPLQEPVH